MWDFSLVDPDNRRPVDFSLRSSALQELAARGRSDHLAESLSGVVARISRRTNQAVGHDVRFEFSARHKEFFQRGSYVPLQMNHGKEEHVVAFARVHDGEAIIVAAPRLSYTLMKGREEPPIGSVWGDSALSLPPEATGKRLRNIFTGEILSPGQSLLCREVFRHFPSGSAHRAMKVP